MWSSENKPYQKQRQAMWEWKLAQPCFQAVISALKMPTLKAEMALGTRIQLKYLIWRCGFTTYLDFMTSQGHKVSLSYLRRKESPGKDSHVKTQMPKCVIDYEKMFSFFSWRIFIMTADNLDLSDILILFCRWYYWSHR